METNIRWLRSDEFFPGLLKKFGAAIAEHVFTPEARRGFFLTRSRNNSISAKFIEKVTGERELVDPFGNRVQLPCVTYEVIQFRLSSEFPQLELINAGRSPKKLLFFLTEISRESFAVAPVELDLKKWIKAISDAFGKAEVSDIDYSDLM